MNPLRLPFRHSGFCYVVPRTYSLYTFEVNRLAAAFCCHGRGDKFEDGDRGVKRRLAQLAPPADVPLVGAEHAARRVAVAVGDLEGIAARVHTRAIRNGLARSM
ncbi:MAG TPA: hypothetical protein VH044_17855 [Polyangiaceae bacterium]|nr:hypothetical protein [Polyangiaceae bacterium]